MTIGGGFRRLTRILRHIEREGWEIDCVEAADGEMLCEGSDIELTVICSDKQPEDTAPHECPIALTDELATFDSCEVGLQRYDDQQRAGMVAALDITVYLPDSATDSEESESDEANVPLHRDHDRLVRLYRTHDTFNQMAEAVREDVSPETIRRYTIEHDIHSPGDGTRVRNGARSGRDEKSRPTTDEFEGIAADEVVGAVEEARTLYDVQRSLDLDRDEAVGLLRELDLLDLVVGRLDRNEDPDQRRATIRRRLEDAGTGEPVLVVGQNS